MFGLTRLLLAFALISISATESVRGGLAPVSDKADESIVANDNRSPAGILEKNTLRLNLDVRQGKLHTEEDSGPAIDVLAFAETGKAPRIPGPLIRVRQGTELIVRITNPFKDSMLTVHGLSDHIDQTDSPIHIPAGESREVRFRATVPGTFFYWATTGNRELRDLDWFESALNGAFIVDSPAAPTNDRIFVLGVYDRPADSTGGRLRPEQIAMTMNGKSWPHTEHFTYAQGDTVRWRWINPSTDSHPMHLHGFYYRLQSKGTWQGEKEFSSVESPQVVTNLMLAGTTMKMWWVADRPGNWIFHCHFSFHTSHYLALPRDGEQSPQAVVRQTDSSAKGMTMTHGPHGMFGLVLGLNILPNGRKRSTASTTMEVRRIRLVAQQKSNRFGKFIGMGYVTQEGNEEPKADSVSIPGPLLILKRGQPTSITVVNHLNEPTAVHWHGIELESFPDGVPGWSGFPGRIMPPIAPRDSFVAEFVPPRAGTFIYHTHDNDQLQMSSGLYGALLVVPRDKPYNPKIDKLFIVGGAGPSDSLPNGSPGYVNGSDAPAAVHLVLGTTYRLRLININPDWRVIFTILSESGMESWRPIAVDGADLPLSQQTLRPANLMTGPGMTADFEFTPRSRGDLRFEIKTATPGWIIPVVLRVN